MSALAIQLFGPPSVTRDGQRIEIETRKGLAILAYLAVNRRPVSRATLAALLWPDYDQQRAAANLRRTLWSLNSRMGAGALSADGERVALAPSVAVDVEAFSRLVDETRQHGHPPHEVCPACCAPLAAAARIAQDPFMAGFSLDDAVEFDDWQSLTATGLRDALAEALRRLAAAHALVGDLQAALDAAQRRAAIDPLDQDAARDLLLHYAWCGQHAAALRAFRELERRLERELGAAPDPHVRAAFEAIRDHAEPPAPGGAPQAAQLPTFLARGGASAAPIFVARERELAELESHLAAARLGEGRVVFVTGEAGQGKTALLGAFARRAVAAHADLVAARGTCNAYTGIGDPYLPFREALLLLTGDVEEATLAGSLDATQAARLWRLIPRAAQALAEQGPDLLDTFVPLAPLLARAAPLADQETLRALERRAARASIVDPMLQQVSLFAQITSMLTELARQSPLLLALDDLQWGDAGSLALLFHLSRRLSGARILILAAYRPNDVALGRQGERHPLEAIVHETQRAQGTPPIDLAHAQGRAFVDALIDSEPNHLGAEFRGELLRQTGGHPLFTSELLRGMRERGDLARDTAGAWAARAQIDWGRLPARVEAVIAERIGRLPGMLRALLRAASVEGEEFSAEVAAALAGVDPADARRQLSDVAEREHRLVQTIGILRVGATRLTRYRFHHFLIQRGLLASLTAAERVAYSEDAGRALAQIYDGRTEEIAVALAHHFDAAELPDLAIGYYQQAGDRALRLSAYPEAVEQYRRALELLSALPPTPERLGRELALQAAYSVPLQHLEGWASARVEAAFGRAIELARQFGSPPATHPLLGRIAHALVYRGEHRRALPLAQEMLALASATEDEATLLEAHTVVGLTHFYMGEFRIALPHLSLALRLYDPEAHASLTYLYGQDLGVHAGLYQMLSLTMLGYVDQGRQQAQETIALAERVGHPFTRAFTWSFVALNAALARDIAMVAHASERGLALASAHAFSTWVAFCMVPHGYARAMRGDLEAGIAEIREGLAIAQPTGARTPLPLIFGLLADLCLAAGRQGEARELIDTALQLAAQQHEAMFLADLQWRDAALRAREGAPWEQVDAGILQAIATARAQDARLPELRACLTRYELARDHAPQQAPAARADLAAVYAWFTEGHDTADLTEAQRALDLPT
jgi:predicted ATPase/DNA-binding SARP family transcriptional activator